ncbi:MAG TPA: hypothetical protein VGJ11_04005 [Gaiellales bacterium]|jgi:hypothetical protein
MAQRWQLRTWTKGTGASVEPAGAPDRPRTRARPGGLPALPPARPWAPGPRRASAPLPAQRVERDARHRHALGYLDEAALDRLEKLEAELGRR